MKIKSVLICCMLFVVSAFALACGAPEIHVALGQYNPASQTFVEGVTGYSLIVKQNTMTITGTVPYSESVIGVPAGHIVTLRITPAQAKTPDAGTSIKTTNAQVPSGWNTYDQSALEADGSLIWITTVAKEHDVQIKIKWNAADTEKTYVLRVANDAVLQSI